MGHNLWHCFSITGVEGSVAAWSTQGATRLVLKMDGENPGVPGSLFISTRPDTQVLDSAGNVIAGAEAHSIFRLVQVWITNIGSKPQCH
jgi:hypothetical protein